METREPRQPAPAARAEPIPPTGAAGSPAKESLATGVRSDLKAGARTWGLVTSRYYEPISAALEAGARSCLLAHGAPEESILTFRVPGAFEIPLGARAVLDSGRADAVIGLGAVIRGETPHFEHVCRTAADGLARLAYETGRPVAFGILTADTVEQAQARAGGPRGNKGWEAALAALEMAELLDSLGPVSHVGFGRLRGA